jgi:hypothetical protein
MIKKEDLLQLIEDWKWNEAKKHIDELYTILERSDNNDYEASPKLSQAYIEGYERGHNDTVEGEYGYVDEKAKDWLDDNFS